MTDNASTKIILGGAEYKIRRLPIGVLRDLDTELADFPQDQQISPREREKFYFDQNLRVLAHALRRDHPEMTLEKLETIESDMVEIYEARREILRFSGLVKKQDPKAGEAPAAAS